ncbi:MAG: hypothetical protein WCI30_00035 [Clostridia bacterium]
MSKTKKKNSNYNYGKTYTEAELKAQVKEKAEKKKLGRRINSARRMGATAPPVKRKKDWLTYATTILLVVIIGLGALILLGKEPLISTGLKDTLSYGNFVLVGILYMLFGYRKHKDTGDIKKGYIFYGLGAALVVYAIVVYVTQIVK